MRNSFIGQVSFADECRKKLPLKEHTPFLCSFNASAHSGVVLNKVLKIFKGMKVCRLGEGIKTVLVCNRNGTQISAVKR